MLGLSSQGIYSHGCVIVLFNTAAEYHTTNVLFVHMFRPLNELSHHCNLVHASMVFVSCCLVLKYSWQVRLVIVQQHLPTVAGA